jgi:hypothetical protein
MRWLSTPRLPVVLEPVVRVTAAQGQNGIGPTDRPPFLLGRVLGVELASQIPQVLAGMVHIHDLDGAGEVLLGDIPYPFGLYREGRRSGDLRQS